jgi:hypothetical protein
MYQISEQVDLLSGADAAFDCRWREAIEGYSIKKFPISFKISEIIIEILHDSLKTLSFELDKKIASYQVDASLENLKAYRLIRQN